MAISSTEFYSELRKLIPNLPEDAVAITIRMRVEKFVTMTAVTHAKECSGFVAKRYLLVEDEEKGAA